MLKIRYQADKERVPECLHHLFAKDLVKNHVRFYSPIQIKAIKELFQ